ATGAQEFAVWDGLTRVFGAGAGSAPDQPDDGIEPLTVRGRRSTEQLQPLIDPIPITGQPRLETLKFGKAPVLFKKHEREQSILNNSPATFDVSPNQAADESDDLHEIGLLGSRSVGKYDDAIRRAAESRGLDPDLVRAIMYMETSRGHYGTFPEFFGSASSYQPMNVRPNPWQRLGVSADDIKNNPSENIRAGAELLARIRDRLPNPTPDRVATLYNSLAKDSVTDYGARVARLMAEKPWNRR
ncbi:MAG: hypothetical protein SFV21_17680, partial [Rhodospirillaceae bacterium]|nr:hypothetical protein [Rhodospirillaceae bacterium]